MFLDDFADTDEEVELDESDEERAIRREERQRTKGKSKAVYNPLASTVSKPKKVKFPPEPAPSTPLPKDLHLLDPNLDPSQMAPSTLVLALRKKRREQKRLHRDQNLRSNLRASTLRTEEDILEKEKMESENRKGRRAQHEMGEIRVVKQKMTQDELIAAAFEEEERNKEALRDWLRKEEERRELRRVGRKRVRGPRWTWVSRTVGKMVEEVEDPAKEAAMRSGTDIEQTPLPDTVAESTPEGKAEDSAVTKVESSIETAKSTDGAAAVGASGQTSTPIATPNAEAGPSRLPAEPEQAQDGPSQYTRNYIILSQIPGGLASELQLVLGDHVEWDRVKFIPHRNRPISELLLSQSVTADKQIDGLLSARSQAYQLAIAILSLLRHTPRQGAMLRYKPCYSIDTCGAKALQRGMEGKRTFRRKALILSRDGERR